MRYGEISEIHVLHLQAQSHRNYLKRMSTKCQIHLRTQRNVEVKGSGKN